MSLSNVSIECSLEIFNDVKKNFRNEEIVKVQIRPSFETDWGGNLLKKAPLKSKIVIHIPLIDDTQYWDMQFVNANGKNYTMRIDLYDFFKCNSREEYLKAIDNYTRDPYPYYLNLYDFDGDTILFER